MSCDFIIALRVTPHNSSFNYRVTHHLMHIFSKYTVIHILFFLLFILERLFFVFGGLVTS